MQENSYTSLLQQHINKYIHFWGQQRHKGDAAITARAYMTSCARCANTHTRHLPRWFYLKSNKTPSFLCCANLTCNKTPQPHKERCAKLQAEFIFSAMALQEAGGLLSPPRRTLGACWRGLCIRDRAGWQQAQSCPCTPVPLPSASPANILLPLPWEMATLPWAFLSNALAMPNNQIYLIQCKQHLSFSWLPFPSSDDHRVP